MIRRTLATIFLAILLSPAVAASPKGDDAGQQAPPGLAIAEAKRAGTSAEAIRESPRGPAFGRADDDPGMLRAAAKEDTGLRHPEPQDRTPTVADSRPSSVDKKGVPREEALGRPTKADPPPHALEGVPASGEPIVVQAPEPVDPGLVLVQPVQGSDTVSADTLAPVSGPAPAPTLVSQKGWIGGLLNATQRAGEQQSDVQGASAPLVSSPAMVLAFGVAVGASGGILGLRRIARRSNDLAQPKAPILRPRPALPALVDRVARAPFDAAACFQLALELLKLGVEQDGLRLLDRSIRLNPMLIVQLLQESAYAKIRSNPGVRRILADVKRDYDRRLLTGYA